MEYVIQGWYSERYGWEDLTSEDNPEDAAERLAEFDESEPTFRHRIKRK